MNIFTYLIGAGASANAVPVVNRISEKMESFRDTLSILPNDDVVRYDYFNRPPDPVKVKDEFIKNLKWLIENTKNGTTIDQYARLLHDNRKMSELKKLKATYSSFLLAIQALSDTDYRYKPFFKNIFINDCLPSNIKIITWNYDVQFELLYGKIKNITVANDIFRDLQSFPIINTPNNIDTNKFFILHLNGGCGVYESESINGFDRFILFYPNNQKNNSNNKIYCDSIEQYYFYLNDKITIHLNFAWEENGLTNQFHKQIENCVKETNYLIVIGYSFPEYNEKIDKVISESMMNLRKVFIQCPKEDHISRKDRFIKIFNKDINICLIDSSKNNKDVDFYIPEELNREIIYGRKNK